MTFYTLYYSMNKKCKTCQELLDTSEFSFSAKAADKLQSSCKACDSKYYKEYRLLNKEAIASRQAAWYRSRHEDL